MMKNLKYTSEINKSMLRLSRLNKSIFLGQSVLFPGNLLYGSLEKIDRKKIIELPVFEETQMGLSIGLSLAGFLPISCFPRFDFLLCSFNQLINHLDKIPLSTKKKVIPKVIIRVVVGAKEPLDAGLQHTQDYTKELKSILHTVNIFPLKKSIDVTNSYNRAIKSKYSSIMIEYTSKHNE